MPARRPRARLNRIEARSLPLRHFTLNGTDHAEDRRLRAVVDWVNVVSAQYPGRQDRLGEPCPETMCLRTGLAPPVVAERLTEGRPSTGPPHPAHTADCPGRGRQGR
ncbi:MULTISPECIES: hypothetical protein [Streptomyces]|uniref:Uncharacterized protein n=1 Tax=Streptomyces mutomycini TaxID=284036 RepID=A0ABW0B400_9ACTN|nr:MULTISPECIES: hypothetical protein [Streptomyces]